MASTIDSYQGEVFHLYIIQGKTLDQVRDILRQEKNLVTSRKILNTKLRKWGYLKNYKRSEYLAILRAKNVRESYGKASSFTRMGRPVTVEKIDIYRRRERIHLIETEPITTSSQTPVTHIVCRTPPPHLAPALPYIHQWRAPEKLLYDSDILVKSSFESGHWTFNGKDRLINSSPAQESELTLLNSFLGCLKIGCATARKEDLDLAGRYWRQAFRFIESLISGQYHDILPNLVQQINDLNNQGFPEVAKQLKRQIAGLSGIRARKNQLSATLVSLGEIDMSFMIDVEQRLMNRYTELFELYLGPLCYSSFVMMMDKTSRKMHQDLWSTFEDHVPAISYLDACFGAYDRRPLDVMALRVEILQLRGLYDEAEIEAFEIISRSQMIHGDDWQRYYQLTRGWYFLGCAQYSLRKHELAFDSFMKSLRFEEDLSKLDSFNIFQAQNVLIQQYLNNMSICGS